MPADLPAVQLTPRPASGRVVTRTRTVRLGDVDDRARLRLDAIARYLQDVATDDTADAELDDAFGWVVRRTMIDVRRTASLDERLELATFCSGTGRSWAERRTSISGGNGATIEAVSLWIRVDPTSGRPTNLTDQFDEIYGPAAQGRRVSTRLSLPRPAADALRRPWPIRRVDIDPLRHVNNAAHWAAVEETLPSGSRRGVGEIEYLTPLDPDTEVELVVSTRDGTDTTSTWLVADDRVVTAARWTPPHPDPRSDSGV